MSGLRRRNSTEGGDGTRAVEGEQGISGPHGPSTAAGFAQRSAIHRRVPQIDRTARGICRSAVCRGSTEDSLWRDGRAAHLWRKLTLGSPGTDRRRNRDRARAPRPGCLELALRSYDCVIYIRIGAETPIPAQEIENDSL